MKKINTILYLWFVPLLSLAQNDSTFHHHLLLKAAPFTFFGIHPAIQLGFETNISSQKTIGMDYAYGNYDLAQGKSSNINGYVAGEISQRFRAEYRWYKNPFGEEKKATMNYFWGVELQNRTNTYPSTTTIGRECSDFLPGLGPNQCRYYEKSSNTNTYHVWGLFLKRGISNQISNHFMIEAYAGLGFSVHSSLLPKIILE